MQENETHTFEEIAAHAKEQGVPGPDVDEHPEGYDGPCFCRLCLSYAAED